jgi:choline dehydrogenase-like flavoprotein
MGPDPAKSVVGMDLKVHGAENLWVMDASIFPTTSSTHTMVPVMSYAWLAAHEV